MQWDKEKWLKKGASGNKLKRKLLKELQDESFSREALQFKAQMEGTKPKVRYDFPISNVYHGKRKGERMISRIRLYLPLVVPEHVADELVEAFQEVFNSIAYKDWNRR